MTRNAARIVAAAAILLSAISPASAKEGSIAGVEAVAPRHLTLTQVARVLRGNREMPADAVRKAGLQAGDKIFLKDYDAVLALRMIASGALHIVRHRPDTATNIPDFVVPQSNMPGVPPGRFTWFMQMFERVLDAVPGARQANDEYLLAASRSLEGDERPSGCNNAGGRTDEPVRYALPGVNAYENHLVAGKRKLFIAWRGGVEPYSVSLQGSDRRILAEAKTIRGACAATLPQVDLGKEPVSLIVTDGNGRRLTAMDIGLTAPLPSMPKEIRSAGLPKAAATIYFATWLATQQDAVWKWEAVQMVNGLGCQAAGVSEWLAHYAGFPACAANRPER